MDRIIVERADRVKGRFTVRISTDLVLTTDDPYSADGVPVLVHQGTGQHWHGNDDFDGAEAWREVYDLADWSDDFTAGMAVRFREGHQGPSGGAVRG